MTFYRVIPGFVIQGGDPTATGTGGPGFTFENEFNSALVFSGSAGQLAMANAGTDSNGGTNGSQFFINLAPVRELDFAYPIFGQLLRGYDALEGIAGTALGLGNYGEYSKPVAPVNITSATVAANDTDAVLLLSATGVCDSVITVTASSAGTVSVQSFTAHAVADATSDPPFLQPIPDVAGPNAYLKLALHGIDLQLDLMAYGFEPVYPGEYLNGPVLAGTSSVLYVPLTPNKDNIFAAALDSWNPSQRGYDFRVFHAAAGDPPMIGWSVPIPAGAFGVLQLPPRPLAVFFAGNPRDIASGFSASVNWGDGTVLSGTQVRIVPIPGLGPVNAFELFAGHTYNSPGEYPVLVKIADSGGARLALTGTANIGPSAIVVIPHDLAGGAAENRVVATFVDHGAAPATAADYSATIDWGDGAVSAGTIRRLGANSWEIIGAHTYRSPDNFTIGATVSRSGGGNNYSASGWSTARISGVKATPEFPPFPQAHLAQLWTPVSTSSNSVADTVTQFSVQGSVTIINSGNEPSAPGSFSVYVDAAGALDGQQTVLTAGGQSAFPIPALQPGQQTVLIFGSGAPASKPVLVLPPGFDPTGQAIIGVVSYSDPVADFDGSQKIVSPGSF